MTFPIVNARVTKVSAPAVEDYDTPAGPGSDVWTGDERAYVEERLIDVVGNGRVDIMRRTTIVIPADVGRLVETSHTLTYEYAGETLDRKVQSVSVVAELGRARVALEDA